VRGGSAGRSPATSPASCARGVEAWPSHEDTEHIECDQVDSFCPELDPEGFADDLSRSLTFARVAAGTYAIDWTASQLGFSGFPLVQRLDPERGFLRDWVSPPRLAELGDGPAGLAPADGPALSLDS